MIRPPKPRTDGIPGSVSTPSLQTSTIHSGTLGSSPERRRALRRSKLLQPQAAISAKMGSSRQQAVFPGTETAIRYSNSN